MTDMVQTKTKQTCVVKRTNRSQADGKQKTNMANRIQTQILTIPNQRLNKCQTDNKQRSNSNQTYIRPWPNDFFLFLSNRGQTGSPKWDSHYSVSSQIPLSPGPKSPQIVHPTAPMRNPFHGITLILESTRIK